MKHIAITYTPRAIVTFTERELEIMLVASERHYDSVCQEASAERLASNRGFPGFLRGAANWHKNSKGKGDHTMDFRQLDTLAKILELAYLSFPDKTDLAIIATLQGSLSATLKALNAGALDDVQIIETP